MVVRAVEMEGTVTGEHGVGLIKRDYLAHETSESTVDAMRKVSHCFIFAGRTGADFLWHSSSRHSIHFAY